MRFVSLGSGSKGNATLVETGGTRLLVDCGFGAREVQQRLQQVGVTTQDLDAILVTHEHGDHVRGVRTLATRFGIRVWSTPGTWRQAGGGELPGLKLFSGRQGGFRIGDVRVMPYPVPHDAREPCQFILESAGSRLGMLTDTGYVTTHAQDLLRECDALMVECNYDTDMLSRGPYPPSLRARVGGRYGHLSNRQTAELLASLPWARLSHLLVAHISEKNNHSYCVREALRQVSADLEQRSVLAGQDLPGPWLVL